MIAAGLIDVRSRDDQRLNDLRVPFAHGEEQRGQTAGVPNQFGVPGSVVVQAGPALRRQSGFFGAIRIDDTCNCSRSRRAQLDLACRTHSGLHLF